MLGATQVPKAHGESAFWDIPSRPLPSSFAPAGVDTKWTVSEQQINPMEELLRIGGRDPIYPIAGTAFGVAYGKDANFPFQLHEYDRVWKVFQQCPPDSKIGLRIRQLRE